jgi:hypothetical protein
MNTSIHKSSRLLLAIIGIVLITGFFLRIEAYQTLSFHGRTFHARDMDRAFALTEGDYFHKSVLELSKGGASQPATPGPHP